jgi:murein DD-endopeptidase MepM/ murein hydrolase activator NlpD
MATVVIAIAVAAWLGGSLGASVQRSTNALKTQVASVLEHDPLPSPLVVTKVFQVREVQGIDASDLSIGATATPLISSAEQTSERSAELASSATAIAVNNAVLPTIAAAPTVISPIPAVTATPEAVQPWELIEIAKGDSLVRIFKRLDLDPVQAITISKLHGAKSLSNLRPGPYLKIRRDGDDLLSLQYQPDSAHYLRVESTGDHYQAEMVKRQFQIKQRETVIEIIDSLYQSAHRAQLPDSITYRLAGIFQWQVDFSTDIRKGDLLTLVYEERFLDEKKVGNGPILAASLETGGKTYHAIRHTLSDGSGHYYTSDGKSLRGAFLRSPIANPRVTSSFSYKRLHPVLKIRRPHLGVDYGAMRGTPVIATADGKVVRASRKGGYGKTIIIRHGQQYHTLYGHLSRYAKGVRKGKSIKQGQVIGYVGTTGLSTGPHLHYEFHVDGKPRDPRKFKIPRTASVSSKEKPAFIERANDWVARLESIHQT